MQQSSRSAQPCVAKTRLFGEFFTRVFDQNLAATSLHPN
jgi:hypothetical protein